MQLLKHFKELTVTPKNAHELKGLILQLALKGKLTNNFNKSIKPTIKENKVEGYFTVPSNWYWDKFDNICEFQMGKTPPSKEMEYWEGDIPWVSIADMTTRGYIESTKKTINELGLKNYFKNTTVKKGTLLMSFKLSIGKTSILNVDACHNEAIISIYPKKTILKEYLFLFLPIISNWGTQVSALMGNTLNKGKIQNLKLPIPPLEEQIEIVKVVETLFKEVEQLEQLTVERINLKEKFVTSALSQLTTNNAKKEWAFLQEYFDSFFNETANIKKLRETVLQLAVQGKLTADWRLQRSLSGAEVEDASVLLKRIQKEKDQLIKDKKIKKEKSLPPITKDEVPYELPDGWVWCRMGTVSDIQRGSSPRPKGDPRYFSETKTKNHWISIKDISKHTKDNILLDTEEYLTDLGTQYSRYVDKNELIVAVSGSTTGKCCLTGIDGYFYDGLAMVRLIGCSIDHQYHLMYYLQLYYHMNDAKFGAAFPNINTKFLNEMMFPFPPLEEQKAIVQKVNALMGLCDALEQQVQQSREQSEQLMLSCLREVFEG
jgi:type I restriction enzyme, S subunit